MVSTQVVIEEWLTEMERKLEGLAMAQQQL